MFTIKKYLHYKNTPDRKPRVLTEEIDYTNLYNNQLVDILRLGYTDKVLTEEGRKQPHKVQGELAVVANLKDCRPLLTAEIEGEEYTELDIMNRTWPDLLLFYGWAMPTPLFHYSDNDYAFFEDETKIGSFFDDPAKYSKLLWGCSEEEGWKKVLKLLDI